MPLLPGCTQTPHLDAFSVGWLINGHWKKRPSSLDYMWQHVPSRNSPAALHLGRKQQIPGPFKEYQSIPYSLLFYRSKTAVKGKLGTVEAGEMTEGRFPARPAARAPARARSPAPARTSASRLVRRLLCSLSGLSSRRSRCFVRSSVHARKPHGRPCLFRGHDQRAGCRRQEARTPF